MYSCLSLPLLGLRGTSEAAGARRLNQREGVCGGCVSLWMVLLQEVRCVSVWVPLSTIARFSTLILMVFELIPGD